MMHVWSYKGLVTRCRYAGFYPSTFLPPLNGSKNSILN